MRKHGWMLARAGGYAVILGPLLLSACNKNGDAGQDADGIVDPCMAAGGWVAIEASEGSQTFANGGGPSRLLIAPGVSKRPPIKPVRDSARLAVAPDRIEADTLDGRTIQCEVDGSHYTCQDQRGLKALRAFVEGARVEVTDLYTPEGFCNLLWAPAEPSFDALVITVPGVSCVSPESVVVEGTLHGYDAAQELSVWLVGELLPAATEDFDDGFPLRRCDISSGRYTCMTLGYRVTKPHMVVVEQAGTRRVKELSLVVDACRVEPVQLDFERPRQD